jgi:hypothetical protein
MERANALLESQGEAPRPAVAKEPRKSEPGRSSTDRLRKKESPRAPRRERRESDAPPSSPEPGQVRLWINLGQGDGLDAAGVKVALETAGGPAEKAISVDLKPAYSFVTVADSDAPAFEGLTGKPLGTKVLKVERAKPPTRRR